MAAGAAATTSSIAPSAASVQPSRIRKDNSGENFAIVRRIALNLLKSEMSTKLGVANKRLKAAWENNYLTTILSTLF